MKKVIDCSVAFKWAVVEPDSDKANRLRDDFRNGLVELIVPDLFPIEIANSLLVCERRGRIGAGHGKVLLADVLTTLPSLFPTLPALLPRAYAIAEASGASAYDCLYVALAEQEACDLITADSRLVNNLKKLFPFVVDLASLP
jgi:predicted nucleic acid-binding protein